MKKKKIHYVQFDIQKILNEPDYMIMSPLERGLYLPMIFVLFANSGSIKYNDQLYKVLNFGSKEDFLQIWEKIKHKFQIRRGKIYCKDVSDEIKRINELTQFYKQQGLKGARKRWAGHSCPTKSDSTPIAKEKETKGKEKKKTENNMKRNESNYKDDKITESTGNQTDIKPDESLVSNSDSSSSSARCSNSLRDIRLGRQIDYHSMRFVDVLNKTLRASSRSDRTCFNNVARFLADGCRDGKYTIEIFDRALEYAKEARSGENPNALFMSLMRSELGYKKCKH